MSPVPRGTFFRFAPVKNHPEKKNRLAINKGKVIEVVPYVRKDGRFVRAHRREL